jgi:hypothetical protein
MQAWRGHGRLFALIVLAELAIWRLMPARPQVRVKLRAAAIGASLGARAAEDVALRLLRADTKQRCGRRRPVEALLATPGLSRFGL